LALSKISVVSRPEKGHEIHMSNPKRHLTNKLGPWFGRLVWKRYSVVIDGWDREKTGASMAIPRWRAQPPGT